MRAGLIIALLAAPATSRDADEAPRRSFLSARIVPIPAFGTKRLEIEYQERLQVEQGQAFFAIPLRPDAYKAQSVGRLSISVDLKSAHALRDFQFASKIYPMQIKAQNGKAVSAVYEARNVLLNEDFALKYGWSARPHALQGFNCP